MTRPVRMLRNIAISVAALAVVLLVAAVFIVQTSWVQNYVKQRIITSIESSTGARAEVKSFRFEWTHFRAVLSGLVLHGNESTSAAPLLRVARVQADLRLFTGGQLWNIASVDVEQPQATVVVYPDGRTNIPTPREPVSSKSPLATIVDLAIGHFEIANGQLAFAAQKYNFDARGNNLRVLLAYSGLRDEYRGQLSLQPLYVVSGRNTPVDLTMHIPLVLARNKIEVQGARIDSPRSTLMLDASVTDLRNPHLTARVNGSIALADLRDAANLPVRAGANLPSTLHLNLDAAAIGRNVQIASLGLTLGQSNLQAAGSLNRGLDFKSRLSLKELARLGNASSHPAGVLAVDGIATLTEQNNLDLDHLQIAGLGAEFTGDAELEHFSRFRVNGDLRHLDLRNALAAAGVQALPYDGVISGAVRIAGSFKEPFLRQLAAQAQLSIAPGRRGIAVSGNLTAAYNGARDNLSIQRSLLNLPHTRLAINGTPGKALNVALTTTNLGDLLAAVPASSRPPIALNHGEASFTGTVTGHLTAPRIAGRFAANHLSIAGRRFDTVTAEASASSAGAAVQNGSVKRDGMQANFSGSLGLRDWKPLPSEPLAVTASIQNGDLADLLALAGQPSAGYSGQLNATLNIHGTVGNPAGSGILTVNAGTLDGESFDRAQAQITLTDRRVTIPSAYLQAGPARVNLTASFEHPRDSFTTGQLQANIQGTSIDLSQLAALQKHWPHTSGTAQLKASLAGDVANGSNGSPRFQLTSVAGDAAVHGLRSDGQSYGDIAATANTAGQTVSYNVSSDLAGSNIRVKGDTQLAPEYPTAAQATFSNLPVQRVLALARRPDIPVAGTLSGTASFNGTLANPQGSADLNLSKAVVYQQALDRIHARLSYMPTRINVSQLEVVSGPSHIDLTGNYDHPADDLESGTLQFRLSPS
ncbi:MAG TPA: hypothetical protein VME17_24985, partial [Bryobacteraceae bacterium]|nr:hypothetical protein [Bryobacteraceae bacterium]